MTQALIARNVNKTASEMRELIQKSKRKLLELEVVLSFAEIAAGKAETISDTKRFVKSLQ